MKRYEQMTKEEIVELVTKCGRRPCAECPAKCSFMENKDELDGITHYLTAEIQMIPRWQTIKTQEDIEAIQAAFRKMCDSQGCESCKYFEKYVGVGGCVFNYLYELVGAKE